MIIDALVPMLMMGIPMGLITLYSEMKRARVLRARRGAYRL